METINESNILFTGKDMQYFQHLRDQKEVFTS